MSAPRSIYLRPQLARCRPSNTSTRETPSRRTRPWAQRTPATTTAWFCRAGSPIRTSCGPTPMRSLRSTRRSSRSSPRACTRASERRRRSAPSASLGARPGRELDLPLGPGRPFLDLGLPLELGVQLVAEEDRHVADPEPDQKRDQAAERAVGLVVGAEVG